MAKDPRDAKTLSSISTVVFGLYLVTLAVALGVALIAHLAEMCAPPTELDLIILVIIAGALGSYVHAATSFASYVGNRRMGKSWIWWYILRPLIGSALALIFYFVIRAGFLQAGTGTQDLNIFGFAALAGLTGMFSKQAADKLREVFDNLFAVKDERADKLTGGSDKGDSDSTTTDSDSSSAESDSTTTDSESV